MSVSRRDFFKYISAGTVGTTAAALGFSPSVSASQSRQYKLVAAKEVRNTCTYCSVGCGILMYSLGDGAKNTEQRIIHIEGDPDHPVSRGSLCPKGAGLLDFIHSPNRLKYPEYRAPGSDKWQRLSWEDALNRIARLMKDDRDANFLEKNNQGQTVNRWPTTAMLTSSAASNETGIIDFKFYLSLGIVATDCQARLCHGPTVAALAPSFGRGAMTNHWCDIRNANVILVMGGNPAEAHPVGYKWAVEAKVRNGAKLMVVDPRFNRSAAVADLFSPIRAGSDAAFLLGVINYLITHNKIQREYVVNYTNAALIVNDKYDFNEGLFSGYDPETRAYDTDTWAYEFGEDGYAKRDNSLEHPRCVYNLLKNHVKGYTPEVVTEVCGTPKADFLEICATLASTCVPNRTATFMYALGWTHHVNGSQMIRSAAMIQLLLGNIGMMGGGVNALRGHANIQGFTDLGLLANRLPGYMPLPKDSQQSYDTYIKAITPRRLQANQSNYWQNTPKFFVSLMKTLFGNKATQENDWGFDWLPKTDTSYDILAFSEWMAQGKINGFICQGFNPIAAFPDSNKMQTALSKLKYLVIVDPLVTETSTFWQNHGEYHDVNPADIQTEVFRLPSACFAEENGTIVNSGRWLQWHWKGQNSPHEAWGDTRIFGTLMHKIRELYEHEGGVCPEPIMNMTWDYIDPEEPTAEEVAKEANGYALVDIKDANGKVVLKKGQLLNGFGELRDDGTTSSFCWLFTGSWTEAGNQMARRDNTDLSGHGQTPGWAWSWPANRRILYNRASADVNGKPWDPKRPIIHWDGEKWTGFDVPDYPANSPPGSGVSPFIMNNDGVGRLFAFTGPKDGPFPVHYEPTESPFERNPIYPSITRHPTARLYADDAKRMGSAKDYPYVATTYSITELFRHWTKHSLLNAIQQPEQFVEISEKLAKSKGIDAGDMVKVTTKRGYIKARAVVTKRMMTLKMGGREIEQVGVPCVWGYEGLTKPGFLANTLTPRSSDSNAKTPEYKAFLVNIEKA